jgi:hypothetical protein
MIHAVARANVAPTGCADLAVHRAGEAEVLAPQPNNKASVERGLGHALGGSAKAIALPSGSGTLTWRTPFEYVSVASCSMP